MPKYVYRSIKVDLSIKKKPLTPFLEKEAARNLHSPFMERAPSTTTTTYTRLSSNLGPLFPSFPCPLLVQSALKLGNERGIGRKRGEGFCCICFIAQHSCSDAQPALDDLKHFQIHICTFFGQGITIGSTYVVVPFMPMFEESHEGWWGNNSLPPPTLSCITEKVPCTSETVATTFL